MATEGLLSLAVFTMASTVTPGGATTMATASGAHFGYRQTLPLMAGIAVGLGSMTAGTAAGLGAIIINAPRFQMAMKVVGTVYLLWLAWRISRNGPPRQASMARPARFLSGLWLTWHNPKGWAIALGAAASFAGIASSPLILASLLGLAFGISAILSLSLWCMAGLVVGRLLRTDRQWHLLNAALGILLALSIAPMWF
ncbi:LysE family translocator [Gluconacetobacter azotocaptans]|nr:LysE family translocator [Gluconacetobacter azotocaptans]